jgi:hypothetical protein
VEDATLAQKGSSIGVHRDAQQTLVGAHTPHLDLNRVLGTYSIALL